MANSIPNESQSREAAPPFRILIAASGSISAYKIADLVSLFKKTTAPRQIEVQCLLTESAAQFVSPLVLETLSGLPVVSKLFGPEISGTEHIRLARWPDLVIFAPATAHLIARLSLGLADDLVTTVALACKPEIPWIIAPAMNTVMWNAPTTQEHVARLKSRGVEFVNPASGVLACGEEGEGKLASVESIYQQSLCIVEDSSFTKSKVSHTEVPHFEVSRTHASRRKILITAGPTTTRIDSVRYITNPSTGKMGAALAEELLARGYDVVYVLGIDKGVVKPRTPESPAMSKLTIIPVTTAEEMLEASLQHVDGVQGIIATAAVMDYKVKSTVDGKLKRATDDVIIELTPSVDVLKTLRERTENSGKWFLGFAAETDDLEANGLKKLISKNLDFLFVNPVERTGYREDASGGFASNSNEGFLLFKGGRKIQINSDTKPEIAKSILNEILALDKKNQKKCNLKTDENSDFDEHEYP